MKNKFPHRYHLTYEYKSPETQDWQESGSFFGSDKEYSEQELTEVVKFGLASEIDASPDAIEVRGLQVA